MNYDRPYTLSFEVMPPRNANNAPKFWHNLEKLIAQRPEFISVTHGAVGQDNANHPEILRYITEKTPILPIAHLTSIGTDIDTLSEKVNNLLTIGVRTFLALRGDLPKNCQNLEIEGQRIESAAELTKLISSLDTDLRQSPANRLRTIARPLSICVAAFPSGNCQNGTSALQEAENLLKKQEAGAQFAITQLYYDADEYDKFTQTTRELGVTIPIIAGIIPTFSVERYLKTEQNTGVKAPTKHIERLKACKTEEELRNLDLDFWENIAKRALKAGSPGVHIFTFNNAEPAIKLSERLNADLNERGPNAN